VEVINEDDLKITVKNWLGHTDIETTESYIHYAEMYYDQYPHSWLKHALRSHKIGRGKREALLCKCSTRNGKIWPILPKFSPVGQSGPAEI